MRIKFMPPYKPEDEPLDIGDVLFGLRWLRFGRTKTYFIGRTDLLTVEGVFEWRNRRYSFRHGIGWLSDEFEIFFNGPHVIRAWNSKKEET
jgi:hypothetical protein